MGNRDSEASRSALKAAARSLFARRGYEGASIREIGGLAGVNPAMIKYHFGDKQGLFSEIVLSDVEAIQSRLAGAVDPEASPAEQLAAFIGAFGSIGETMPEIALILVREQMSGAMHLERHVRDRFFGFFLRSAEIIEAGVRSGKFRPVDPHATHLSLVGSLVYYLLTMPARETYEREGGVPTTMPTPAEYVDHVTDFFLRGLSRGGTGALTETGEKEE